MSPLTDLTFDKALVALKAGKHIARRGWNGKGMWIVLLEFGPETAFGYPLQPCIAMKTADHLLQPGWLASQADLLAGDWQVLS